MSDAITGKIAAVIDDTTLVLNVGSNDGAREGMVFAVVSAHQDIADPDSGESLGLWESVKARVVVSHVQERMCTARSFLREEVDASGTLSTLMVRHSFGLYGGRRDDRQSLDVQATAALGRPKTQPIQVGDLARSVAVETSAEDTEVASGATAADLPSQAYAPAAGASGAEGEGAQTDAEGTQNDAGDRG